MPDPLLSPAFEEYFRRLVNKYVEPVKPQPIRRVLELLQPISIIMGVIAVVLSLPQVSTWLHNQQTNDELRPLSRALYASAIASSYVDPSVRKAANVSYTPGNVLDDNPATAWQECGDQIRLNKSGVGASPALCKSNADPGLEGKGQWLELTLVRPITLRGLRIRNGYQRNYNLFRSNPKVKQLMISTFGSNGQPLEAHKTQALSNDFAEGYQYIDIGAKTGPIKGVSAVRLRIESAYPSQEVDGKQWQDNGISDVQLVPYRLGGTTG